MRLMELDAYREVFEPLRGKRIGYIQPLGNVGDSLIELATRQLFDAFGIRWRPFNPDAPPTDDVDELVFGGGGNMGQRYRNNWDLRTRALATGLPLTILPQSFTSREERGFKRVFARERVSMAYCRRSILAPDLALGFDCHVARPPRRELGVFLRRDPERISWSRWFRRDPARLCRTPQEYIELAADHARIVTDRLHFAVSGLLAGRETTLLANDYHKNWSMYDTWLRALGCRFARSVGEALGRRWRVFGKAA